ncbi:MAG: hypothetical protein NTY41_01740 [Proteobacteria bacterium]|nr:hypothetical protein [Pseudomonadota bacterium]
MNQTIAPPDNLLPASETPNLAEQAAPLADARVAAQEQSAQASINPIESGASPTADTAKHV